MDFGPTHPETIAAVLRYARARRGGAFVVKLGGFAMDDPAALKATLESVALLRLIREDVVLVHGGGKAIDRAMGEAKLTPVKVQGRRVTDVATLEIVVRVLTRETNPELVRALEAQGCPAQGYDRLDGFPLSGGPLSLTDDNGGAVDLGAVGTVDSVNVSGLREAMRSRVPVIPSLAVSSGRGWLNVNADTAACALPRPEFPVGSINFLTEIPGVLRDVADPTSLIPRLTRAECEQLRRDGVIAGGMIPKVEACLEALDRGVGSARILDGRVPYVLLQDLFGLPRTGTEIVP